jgi:hypothetical protein
MPNPAPVGAVAPPYVPNGTVANWSQYVTGSGADIWTCDGGPVSWMFIVFRPSARLTPAGKFAADAQKVAYLTTAKITAIDLARGTTAAVTGAQWGWDLDNLYGYPVLPADEVAQVGLWVTLLGVGANVQKGGNP